MKMCCFKFKITYRVHFKIDQLPSGERNDNLSLVNGAFDDLLLAGHLPVLQPLIRPYVAHSIWVHLGKKRIWLITSRSNSRNIFYTTPEYIQFIGFWLKL
jgi:hypothetical protein